MRDEVNKQDPYVPLFCMLSRRRHRKTVMMAMMTTKAMPATQAMMMMTMFVGISPDSSATVAPPFGTVGHRNGKLDE